MKNLITCCVLTFLLLPLHAQVHIDTLERSYAFRGSIPENVLRSYLSRSIVMMDMCVPEKYLNEKQKLFREDDERMIFQLGAKHISRVVGTWGRESKLADPEYFSFAKAKMKRLLEIDPELLFEGAIYECVSMDVESIDVPAWVFEDFGLAVEIRKFDYASMLFSDGWGVDKWGADKSVPDMSQLETRLWYYYAAHLFIDAGIENIHYGNSSSTTYRVDRLNDYAGTRELLSKVRAYGATHARRGMVLINGNLREAPGGELLYDYITFASRIKEVASDPGGPLEGQYEIGYYDAIYQKTPGGVTPSGWQTERSLFVVHIDHTGISDHPGEMSLSPDHWVWGYDETTWFALQPEAYRNRFLRYAWNWVRENDDAGYVKIPGNKPIYLGDPELWDSRYRANSGSFIGALGYNQEQTIRELWDVRRLNVHHGEESKSYPLSSIQSIRFDAGEMRVRFMSQADSVYDSSLLSYCDFTMNAEAFSMQQDTSTSVKINPDREARGMVYPNPFSGELIIDCSAMDVSPVRCRVYDLQGRLLLGSEFTGGQKRRLNTHALKAGFYLCHLESKSTHAVFRILKH